MSDEPVADAIVAPAKPKRGRPPKKRHDPAAEVPIDSDYRADAITGKQEGFDYALMSDRDRARRQHMGWEPELWGPNCARPLYDFGKHSAGEEVRINNQLTLMRIPTARRAAIRAHERQWHTDAKANLKRVAENSGGRMTSNLGVQF